MEEVIKTKNNNTYEVVTVTRAEVRISEELGEVLQWDLDYEFDYRTADIFSSYLIERILEDKDEYGTLSEQDFKDVEDIIELLEHVNHVRVEIAL